MTNPLPPVIVVPAASGAAPNLTGFRVGISDATRFETLAYPGWQRYVANGFSAEVLIADLAAQITMKVPQGKIRIVGVSIGGHFGYATALHLNAIGREIAGFCAIDTFMISSSEPSTGWIGRALSEGLELLGKRRIGEFIRFARSKLWRSLLRLAGSRLPNLLCRFGSAGRLPSALAFDPIFEEELSMRLLIREVAPWIASLDLKPVALKAPAILIRSRISASSDVAWRRRCPNIQIFEIPGQHQTLFEPENIETLRETFITATAEWHGG
jgi:thioesterase domain-containing protein